MSKHSPLHSQTPVNASTSNKASTPRFVEHPVHQYRKLIQQQQAQATLTNKYYLAGTARTKLAYEAEEVDHNLLRLVGHANFLDRLQDEIDSAEKLHETRHQARLVRNTVSPKKSSIIWADTRQDDSSSSDEEQTSSDSECEDEILELARVPTRYQLPPQPSGLKGAQKKAAAAPRKKTDEAAAPRRQVQVKVVQVASALPGIADEEDEVDGEGVTSLLKTFEQGVVVGVA